MANQSNIRMHKIIYLLKICFIPCMLASYMACSTDALLPSTEMEILNKELSLPSKPYNYANLNTPSFFNSQFVNIQNNTTTSNPITDWGATLGRVIYYDKLLSANKTIACASCHLQQFGFTDTAKLSTGFSGGFTGRHSMSLINATYYINGRFFWDERAATLEEQVLKPIQDSIEMGMTLDLLVSRMKNTTYYPILFKYAFGNSDINAERISKALAQFVRSIVSYNSKYDIGRSQATNHIENFSNFTAQENMGKKIFMTQTKVNCFGCHNTDVFVMDNPRNNGLYTTNTDVGIYKHTNNPIDIGKFKAPSLKNIALRKRFMHDGSLQSLEDVVNHYNFNIQANPNLDPHLQDRGTNKPYVMNLSPLEVEAVVAFLHTLTDEVIVKDPKYSSPFK